MIQKAGLAITSRVVSRAIGRTGETLVILPVCRRIVGLGEQRGDGRWYRW